MAVRSSRPRRTRSGVDAAPGSASPGPGPARRDPLLAAWRAQVEGPAFQISGPDVVLGGGGFADDTAPAGALVQLGADAPLAPGVRAARAGAGRVQGRNSTVPLSHPVEVPAGDWALTLQTTWVEPAYVEPDASWCRPGEPPATPLANGGAFGGQAPQPGARLEPGHWPTRPATPSASCGAARTWCAAGPSARRWPSALRPDGTGVVRVGRTRGFGGPGSAGGRACARLCPGVEVEEVDVAGPAGCARPARRRLGRGARRPARAGRDRRRAGGHGSRRRGGARCRARRSVELRLDDGATRAASTSTSGPARCCAR